VSLICAHSCLLEWVSTGATIAAFVRRLRRLPRLRTHSGAIREKEGHKRIFLKFNLFYRKQFYLRENISEHTMKWVSANKFITFEVKIMLKYERFRAKFCV
jgi:hypothetical protein